MKSPCLLCVLLLSAMCLAQAPAKPAQQKPSPAPGAPPAAAPGPRSQKPLPPRQMTPPPELPPDTPIVTLTGVCEKPAEGAECKTVITKAKLDEVADVIAPDSPPNSRQRLAVMMAQSLVMAREAEKQGEAQKPEVQQALAFMRNSMLAQVHVRQLQKEAAKVDPAEIEKYYNEHKADFEQAKISRVYIPKNVSASELKPGAKPVDEKAARAEADKIQARAAAGGDLSKLQDAAFADLGLKQKPPNTDMGMVRKQNLSPEQEKVFEQKPGEVSPVQDLAGGFFIFKVESKNTQDLESAKPEVLRILENESMRRQIEAVSNSVKVDFNSEFFRGRAPAQLFPAPPRPGERPGPEEER